MVFSRPCGTEFAGSHADSLGDLFYKENHLCITLSRFISLLSWLCPSLLSGLVVLTMMLTADRRLIGIALIAFAIIPLGDMSIVLGSGGSKSKAFSIHGVTCAVMLVVGLLLIRAI